MFRILVLLGLLPFAACAPLPPGGSDWAARVHWVPSPNHDQRNPNFVVLHQTSNDTAEHALRTLTDPARKVSAHYLVGRDGMLYQLVDERARAWHAGESYWGGLTDLNSASIGIELDNNGEEPFSDVQISTLLDLLADLKVRYRIPTANFVGHGDIAPSRKVDPSRHFPWRALAARGFGLWCDAPAESPPDFDARLALQALGYATTNFDAAALAFRRRFAGDDATAELTAADKAMLFCLVQSRAGD